MLDFLVFFFLHGDWECFDTVQVVMGSVKEAEMLRAYRTCGNSKLISGKGDLICNIGKKF